VQFEGKHKRETTAVPLRSLTRTLKLSNAMIEGSANGVTVVSSDGGGELNVRVMHLS